MAEFVRVPPKQLAEDVLWALLEEYASRDGTDYGEREQSLAEKVTALQVQVRAGDIQILYDTASEHWDLMPRLEAEELLNS